MKLTDNDRSELLESLFPLESATAVHADDLLRWIHMERKARRRRLRYTSIAAVVLLLAVSVATLFPRKLSEGTVANISPPVPQRDIHSPPPEPVRAVVEQVDDDALMGLLDDTPAALVAWPDGRRSLLVVVRPQEL